MRRWYKSVGWMLALSLMVSTLSACGPRDDQEADAFLPVATDAATESVTEPLPSEAVATETVSPTDAPTPETNDAMPTPQVEHELTDVQRNSINMLNHLVVLTQEINASSASRRYLENAYSELYDNTYPNAVDTRTQVEINYLFQTIEDYRMIEQKRERLEYLYEQDQAQAMRDALPNPLGLLSAVHSFSLSRLVASVAYMALDSYNSYQTGSAQAELQYLQNGWALDDEQSQTLHEIRSGTFDYMIDTVRDYNLPGELALNESSVADFVKWKENDNLASAILFFEDNVEVYQAFGPYWLTLAEFYHKIGEDQKCLDAVKMYERVSARIFRKDHLLARALPYAIDAASRVLPEDEYVSAAEKYAEAMVVNTENSEWALRYFAAQTYVDLAGRTGDDAYLEAAYRIVRSNANNLLEQQETLNEAYLADVQTIPEPKGATKAQKEDVKQYNLMLKERRKKELPPVSEPLLLNCDLLFSLAERLQLPAMEQTLIDDILHENGSALFLTAPLDQRYWFDNEGSAPETTFEIAFAKTSLTLPAELLTDNAAITVTVAQDGTETVLDDWTLEKVERPAQDIHAFRAVYTSAEAKQVTWHPGAAVRIAVRPTMDIDTVFTYDMTAVEEPGFLWWTKIVFERVSE